MKHLIYFSLAAFLLLMSCKERPAVLEYYGPDSSQIADNQGESSGESEEDKKTITIPFEFDNPVANVVAFDIDKNGSVFVSAENDFLFEVLTEREDNDNHIINPVSEHKEEHFVVSMTESNVCKLDVFKQSKPYSIINKHIIFYSSDNEVLEDIYLIIDEDATSKEY